MCTFTSIVQTSDIFLPTTTSKYIAVGETSGLQANSFFCNALISSPNNLEGPLHLGSTEFGTYGYTPFAEWFLILGNFGYVFFGFFSGLLNRLIINSINKIGYNFFCLVLFSDLFFLKYPFIKINDIDNILLIIFIVYAFFLYLCFNTFKKYF